MISSDLYHTILIIIIIHYIFITYYTCANIYIYKYKYNKVHYKMYLLPTKFGLEAVALK